MTFEVKDRAAAGRLGRFETRHGAVATPTLLPVVNPNLAIVPPADMKRLFGAEMVITNSYILRKHDRLRERALAEGVHKTIGWDGPIMTDSGTFQSYVYGSVDVKPLEIIDFQKRIGVDVGTILDVFTTPDKSEEVAGHELDETLRRAREAVGAKEGMLLAATVQGGVFPALRARAAQAVGELDVDLVPIGGVVPLMEQGRYAELARVIVNAKRHLPSGKPVHLFGAGHPLVFPLAAALGCDLFDSASYAKYAKDGRLIFAHGTRLLSELEELACVCPECLRWKNAPELRRAAPHEREAALARHNLHVSFAEIRRVRQAIRDGNLWELVEERAAQNPGLQDALRVLRGEAEVEWLERCEPVSAERAFQYRSPHTLFRPLVRRLHERLLKRWTPRPGCIVLPERPTPYATSYASWLGSLLKTGNDLVVETAFGPVPLEFERTFPIAQSVFPQSLDAEARGVRDAFAQRFYGQHYDCEVFPFEPAEHESSQGPTAAQRDDFDLRRLHALADHTYGVGAGKALLEGDVRFVRSEEGLVRNVYVGDDHALSLRARDGRITLRLAGARRLVSSFSGLRNRIRLEAEPASYVRQGRNAMAKFVVEADPDLRPGDDAVLVDPNDDVVGVGRCLLAGWEMRQFRRGAAARNTEGAKDE